MSEYKVSVVVPTYNSGLFLNAFLDSMMYQSIGFENIQIIFVDDNSTDDYTLYLLEIFDENFSNIKSVFLDENNGFPGRGRNIGLDLADADYVIFSDHDDTYTPKALETMYNKAVKENADLLITNYYKVFDDEKIKTETVFNGENTVVHDFRKDLRLFDLDPSIWTKIFNKKFLDDNNIRFLEGMLAEDLYFFVKSLFKADCIVYLDNFFSYNYNIRNIEGDKSTIHVRNKKYLGKMIEGYYKIDELLYDLDLTDYYSNIFKMHFVYWITSLVLSDISNSDKVILIQSINELLKKQVKLTPGFDERIYMSLTKPVLNDDYKKVVKNLNFIKRYRRVLERISDVFKR